MKENPLLLGIERQGIFCFCIFGGKIKQCLIFHKSVPL